jgi:hypothetical protein
VNQPSGVQRREGQTDLFQELEQSLKLDALGQEIPEIAAICVCQGDEGATIVQGSVVVDRHHVGMHDLGEQGDFAGESRAKTSVQSKVSANNLDRNVYAQVDVFGQVDVSCGPIANVLAAAIPSRQDRQ